MLQDINSQPRVAALDPDELTAVGDILYFVGTSATHGGELWKTDGTAAGTALVKDILPGTAGSLPRSLTNVNGVLYFSADDGIQGEQLWRSDGTAAGTTRVVTTTGAGLSIPYPASLAAVGDALYLGASGGDGAGVELWKTDGTPGGAVRVADIHAGSSSASPSSLTNVGGVVFFAATSAGNGTELWKSDGTAAGTTMVRNIAAGSANSSPTELFAAGGKLYFSATDGVSGIEPYVSDGTQAGTFRLADIYASGDSSPAEFASLGSKVYFAATDATRGRELWATDGTAAGTHLLLEIRAGAGGSSPGPIVPMGGSLYFPASASATGFEMWISDGTAAGTQLLLDVRPGTGNSYPHSLVAVGDWLFFEANDGSSGFVRDNPWATRGTAATTVKLSDARMADAGFNGPPAALGNVAYFVASITQGGLWTSDGTPLGTTLITMPAPGTYDAQSSAQTAAGGLVNVGSVALFVASATPGQVGLWVTDGAPAGTALLLPFTTVLFGGEYRPVVLNGEAYFYAHHATAGRGLWASDGTAAGTRFIASFTEVRSLTSVGQTLFFRGSESVGGSELWKSDGTTAGTMRVKDILPGSASSSPFHFAVAGDTLFFVALDATHGYELWRSDGTDAGTTLVKDIRIGSGAGISPDFELPQVGTKLVAVGEAMFFTATDGTVAGGGLWRSDGTEAGTMLVKQFTVTISNSVGAGPVFLVEYAGQLLFVEKSSTTANLQLWASNGSSSGTVIVGPLGDDPRYAEVTEVRHVGGFLYLAVQDTRTRRSSLWRTDGTPGGTVKLGDFLHSIYEPGVREFADVDGVLYFLGAGDGGEELWTSDGTPAGTHLVHDFTGDSGGSEPQSMTLLGDKFLAFARTEAYGLELWVQSLGPVAPGDFDGSGLVDGGDFLWWQRTSGGPEDLNVWQSEFGGPRAAGDYALDGHVDGADFLAWQRALRSAAVALGAGADGDRDGQIGPGDLLVWTANFGATEGASALAMLAAVRAVAPTPPASLIGEPAVRRDEFAPVSTVSDSTREAVFAASDVTRFRRETGPFASFGRDGRPRRRPALS